MSMALTSSQVTDLLSRNGTLAGYVQRWNLANYFLTYNQDVAITDVSNSESFLDYLTTINSPIPPYGLEVNDPTYGYVDVFPDASGNLNFTATGSNIPNASAQQIPSGGAQPIGLPSITGLQGSLNLGLVLGIGVIAYLLYNEYRKA